FYGSAMLGQTSREPGELCSARTHDLELTTRPARPHRRAQAEGGDMNQVTSKDGTTIAFDRSGDGPPVVLVGGALADRSAGAPLAALLAPHLTVFAYDRRGRGNSGDTPPYAVEREVEDIGALID